MESRRRCADAAPEQVNSFVQSKTEVFEKIEESLKSLCMVEDLKQFLFRGVFIF